MSRALVPLTRSGGQIPPSAPPPPTLRELVPRFLLWTKFVREQSEHTVHNYGFDLRSFLTFCDRVGLTWPGHVTYREIEGYQAWLRHERQVKPGTVNRHLHCLRSFWRWLIREGVTLTNPAADVPTLKQPERLPKFLPVHEQERCLTELARDRSLHGQRDYALIATILLCGLRCSEAATLKVEDVDLHSGTLTVIGKGNKQGQGVVIPRLRRILEEYLTSVRPALAVRRPQGSLRRTQGQPRKDGGRRRRHGWVATYRFDGRRVSFSTGTADKDVARARLAARLADLAVQQQSPYLFLRAHPGGSRFKARAGRPLVSRAVYRIVHERLAAILGRPIHPHQLRHSFATRLYEGGADPLVIRDALRHKSIATTEIYTHLTTTKRRADIAKYLQ